MSDNIEITRAIGYIEAGNVDLPACQAIREYIEHLEQTNAKFLTLIEICKKENIQRVEFLSKILEIGR